MLPDTLSWGAGALVCVLDKTFALETSLLGHEGECAIEEVLKEFLWSERVYHGRVDLRKELCLFLS